MKLIFLILIFAFSIPNILCQKNCHGQANTNAIITQTPILQSKTSNGSLSQVNQIQPPLNVLHVYGTPYQMGFAHGTLMKNIIVPEYNQFMNWIFSQIKQYEKFLPNFLQDLVNKGLYNELLDVCYSLLKDYISDEFKQEVQGIADGSGMSFTNVMRINIFPEVIQASCSIIGAYGDAIKNVGGTLYQVRALDWNTNGPFQQWPLFIVYHPESNNGHPFSILTWPGLVGAMTGFSSSKVGICEKVWLEYKGHKSREGTPWNMVLRDILQYDNTVTEGLNRLIAAHRTCSIWVGLGHTNQSQVEFNIVSYSYEEIDVYNDMNLERTNPNHPQLNGVVYVDKHVQPSGDPCLGELLTNNYGNLDAPTVIRNVTSIFQTGDMHLAVYDFAQNLVYVSNASPWINNTCVNAYDRPFVRLNMTQLFSQTL